MSFEDRVKALAQRVPQLIDHLETEEATKNALVMPFIAALGYDVFNPQEVVPEFTADVGTKRGEKVDYAIKRGDEVIILIEAKTAREQLDQNHLSQLYRYFSVTSARIAVLTNGVEYRFYSDLEETNKLDSKPFIELNLLHLRDNSLAELRKLTKAAFDLEKMLAAASDLKYMREIRRAIETQLEEPEEDFVRYFFNKANPSGRFVQSAREQFTHLVRRAFQQVISDKVSDRLRSALAREDHVSGSSAEGDEADPDAYEETAADSSEIVTTEEELEGFRIVKAIVCSVVPPERVAYRDQKSYFGILFDDNNRKPICRLHFNRVRKKCIGLFDADKNETRHPIEQLDDIYRYAENLRETASRYFAPSEESDSPAPVDA